MERKPSVKSISVLRFLRLVPERDKVINAAPVKELPKEFPANLLAKALHPDHQYVKISDIRVWNSDCKTFTFVPDPARGTESLAYFKAGSYISVFLNINGVALTRPYSLSSSPKEALNGTCSITVKRVPGGTASNYMLDNWAVGDEVVISGPLGEFTYLPIRDGKTVIGAAGGSGITPFYSFAKAIADGDEDFRLILLYGSRTQNDILFKEEFDELQKQSDKVKVVHVLSDEETEGFEHGFITADLISKYAPDEPYSIFLCGPQAMYNFLDKEIAKLGLERKWVRHELQGEVHNPKSLEDYPEDVFVPEKVSITVSICGQEQVITANSEDTILQSLEKNGIAAPARCRSGECGWCHSKLVSGKVYAPALLEHRRAADLDYNFIHLCCTFPLSDIKIEVPLAR